MNPEFERNLWIEMTSRRVVLMPVVLGLIFLTTYTVSGNNTDAVTSVARTLYYVMVLVWGSRAAAGAVVNELRERTWDGQRLSAISPSQMLAGKLLGVTSYQWYGGLICLVPMVLTDLLKDGPATALSELVFFLAVGLFAQSAALFASLIAVRRRADHSRFDIFLFMMTGIIVGWIAAELWNVSYVTRLLSVQGMAAGRLETIEWYDLHMPLHAFYLMSLAIFLGWSLLGNLTLLRGELQVRTSPLPWLAFSIFMIVYCAGFADQLLPGRGGLETIRTTIAIAVAAGLTYVSVLLEPKNPVLYRWMLSELGKGRLDHMLGALQGWMLSLVLLTGLVVYQVATFTPPFREVFGYTDKLLPALVAAYFFVARDVGIFLYFNLTPQARRGDFAAVITLAVLYLVLPTLLGGMPGGGQGLPFVLPYPANSATFAMLAPALEAAVIWGLALNRLRGLMADRSTAAA